MKNYIIKPLLSNPGIQRDGTPFASQSYIDGQWCRFYMGRPRKMGGYRLIDGGDTEIIRSLYGVLQSNSVDVYMGRASSLKYNNFDLNGNGSGEIDRTPTDYVADDNNVWDFDLFTNTSDTSISSSYIVAAAIPNGDDVSNTTNGSIYSGDSGTSNPLTPILYEDNETPVQVSGGIVFSSPVLVAFGNNGLLQWSKPNEVTGWDSSDNLVISNDKIIQAYRTRGSSTPQLLCWTLSSVISVTYLSDSTTSKGYFSSTTIQDDITVLSPDSIVQYNQQFFWIGIDQFYVYNGIVQRLENSMSSDWFFNNLNFTQRSKVWGMVIPRYKEIWWFYPRGTATECNAVVIYNTELRVWYDSVISRAAGLSPSIFPLPLMSDTSTINIPYGRGISNIYPLWEHETGNDIQIGEITLAIDSYFETKIMTLFESDPSNNRLVRTRRIEPDFSKESSNMTVTVNNRMFPQDSLDNGYLTQVGPFTFNGDTRKIDDVASQGRLVSFVFQSNEVGGYYQMGQPLLDYEVGDVNP